MVAEAWILKMGNQVSHNLKHALSSIDSSKKTIKKPEQKEVIGILSFEVANIMSKTVCLHKSLTDQEISKLKTEILKSEGVISLVSSDEFHLLELALAEKLDDLNRIANVVSRLGRRCTEPALQGFEHVFGDIVNGVIEVRKLGFLVKDMEGMVRKMERYVSSTANLYNEIQVLNELEQGSKKFQMTQHEESKRVYEQKLMWQKQDVRHLKDVSLWNQTFDKIVGLLARTVCTIYARVCTVFGDYVRKVDFPGVESREGSSIVQSESGSGLFSGPVNLRRSDMACRPASSRNRGYDSGPIRRVPRERRGITARSGVTSQRNLLDSFHSEEISFPCAASPGRLFMECLSLSSSASLTIDDEIEHEGRDSQSVGCCSANGLQRDNSYPSGYFGRADSSVPFGGEHRQLKSSLPSRPLLIQKSRLMSYASPFTIGGSALALHYANVIIVIEKLLRYPHLVGDEARDDLYQMLPTSLRMSLRKNLKSYVKNLAIYDAPLAHDWKATLDKILRWLAPLAHNMIRWQTERNLEQQQIVTRTNVLLLQTLYFADRGKTEAVICELLVGLNYICRYEQQQNALLDCASSFDFDDCMEWRWQDSFL